MATDNKVIFEEFERIRDDVLSGKLNAFKNFYLDDKNNLIFKCDSGEMFINASSDILLTDVYSIVGYLQHDLEYQGNVLTELSRKIINGGSLEDQNKIRDMLKYVSTQLSRCDLKLEVLSNDLNELAEERCESLKQDGMSGCQKAIDGDIIQEEVVEDNVMVDSYLANNYIKDNNGNVIDLSKCTIRERMTLLAEYQDVKTNVDDMFLSSFRSRSLNDYMRGLDGLSLARKREYKCLFGRDWKNELGKLYVAGWNNQMQHEIDMCYEKGRAAYEVSSTPSAIAPTDSKGTSVVPSDVVHRYSSVTDALIGKQEELINNQQREIDDTKGKLELSLEEVERLKKEITILRSENARLKGSVTGLSSIIEDTKKVLSDARSQQMFESENGNYNNNAMRR